MARLHYDELQELACAVLGLDYDDVVNEGRESEIDEKLYEKFDIDIEQFQKVAEALIEFTPIVGGGLTGKMYHTFGKALDKKGGFFCIAKSEFIPPERNEKTTIKKLTKE